MPNQHKDRALTVRCDDAGHAIWERWKQRHGGKPKVAFAALLRLADGANEAAPIDLPAELERLAAELRRRDQAEAAPRQRAAERFGGAAKPPSKSE